MDFFLQTLLNFRARTFCQVRKTVVNGRIAQKERPLGATLTQF